MDWDLAVWVSLCILIFLLVYIAVDFVLIRRQMKKKEKMRKEANQKDFMDEDIDKLNNDEVSKE